MQKRIKLDKDHIPSCSGTKQQEQKNSLYTADEKKEEENMYKVCDTGILKKEGQKYSLCLAGFSKEQKELDITYDWGEWVFADLSGPSTSGLSSSRSSSLSSTDPFDGIRVSAGVLGEDEEERPRSIIYTPD